MTKHCSLSNSKLYLMILQKGIHLQWPFWWMYQIDQLPGTTCIQ